MFKIKCLILIFSLLLLTSCITNSRQYINILKDYTASDNLDKAIIDLKELIKQSPDYHLAYRRVVKLYYYKKDVDSAIHWLENLIKKNTDHKKIYYWALGLAFEKKGDIGKAHKLLIKAIKEDPYWIEPYLSIYTPYLTTIYTTGMSSIFRSEDIKSYNQFCQELINEDEENAAAYIGLQLGLHVEGNYEEALKYSEKALKLKPDLYQALLFQANNLWALDTNNIHKVLRLVEKANSVAKKKQDFIFQFYCIKRISYLEMILGLYESAKKTIAFKNKLANLIGEKEELIYNFLNESAFYIKKGLWDNAYQHLKKGTAMALTLDENPLLGRFYYYYALYNQSKGRYPEALNNLKNSLKIVKSFKMEMKIYLLMGDIYHIINDYEQAIQHYQKVNTIYNEKFKYFPEAHNDFINFQNQLSLGRIAFLKERYETAVLHYEEALVYSESLETRADMNLLYFQLGQAAEFCGDLDAAEKWYNILIPLSVYDEYDDKKSKQDFYNDYLNKNEAAKILFCLGRLNMVKKNYYRAENCFWTLNNKISDITNEDFKSHFYSLYGQLWEILGYQTKAIECYIQSIDFIEIQRRQLGIEKFKIQYGVKKKEVYEQIVMLYYKMHIENPHLGYDYTGPVNLDNYLNLVV